MKTTTKVIAAVLAVLMLSVVFAGAAAAAAGNGEPVYVYKLYEPGTYVGTWTLDGDSSISIEFQNNTSQWNFIADKEGQPIKEGSYIQKAGSTTHSITVKYPYAQIYLTYDGHAVMNNGKVIPVKNETETKWLNFTIDNRTADDLNISGLIFTDPSGIKTYNFGGKTFKDVVINRGNWNSFNDNDSDYNGSYDVWSDLKKGDWTVQAYFNLSDDNVSKHYSGLSDIYSGIYISPKLYTFKVGELDGYTITVDKKEVVAGKEFVITIDGTKDGLLKITAEDKDGNEVDVKAKGKISMDPGQPGISKINNTEIDNLIGKSSVDNIENVSFDLSYTFSKVVLKFKTDKNTPAGVYKFAIYDVNGKDDKKKSVTVNVVKPAKETVTLNVAPNPVYIGEPIKISGTGPKDKTLYLYISGVNVKLQEFMQLNGKDPYTIVVKADGNFSYKYNLLNTYDAGTYTITATTEKLDLENGLVDKNKKYEDADKYTTSFVLKKIPFITLDPIRDNIAIGSKVKISGIAEGNPKEVGIWIFGTNLFNYTTAKVKDNKFTKSVITNDYDAGHYFLVVQHPMADKKFNIVYNDTIKSVVSIPTNESGVLDESHMSVLSSSLAQLQKENAAHDLMVWIDASGHDDLYVTEDFILAEPYFKMNKVGDIAAGTPDITISGITNIDTGKEVTVTISSSSSDFGEKDKHDLTQSDSSVTSITVKAKVVEGDEENTWSAVVNTAGLAKGEYFVKAEVTNNDKSLSTLDAFEVTEASVQPTAEPTQPAQPTQPAEPTPASPGFGALIALAGLGAVALLVLRRN